MPVTPFHFGVGLLAKGIAPRHVSLSAFCLTQVAIDCESGYFLFTDQWPAHRFFHTIVGASLLCGAIVVLAEPILRRLVTRLASTSDAELARWMTLAPPPRAVVLIATAVLGVLGHVVPDAIMHSDMHPFRPLTDWNPFHESLSLSRLHVGLVLAGPLGFFLATRRRPTPQGPQLPNS